MMRWMVAGALALAVSGCAQLGEVVERGRVGAAPVIAVARAAMGPDMTAADAARAGVRAVQAAGVDVGELDSAARTYLDFLCAVALSVDTTLDAASEMICAAIDEAGEAAS